MKLGRASVSTIEVLQGLQTRDSVIISDLSAADRARIRNRQIGFICQAFNLIGDLTVYENVELLLTYRGMGAAERKKRTLEALERVGMSHRVKHYPAQLSEGQQQRVAIRVVPRPESVALADRDQLEQALINPVRNAVDATMETVGGVEVTWRGHSGRAEVTWRGHSGRAEVTWRGHSGRAEVLVRDEGPGLTATANLFVPYFTTKPQGTGIGLVLARQIAEGHGGFLTLENRADRSGCVATLSIPSASR